MKKNHSLQREADAGLNTVGTASTDAGEAETDTVLEASKPAAPEGLEQAPTRFLPNTETDGASLLIDVEQFTEGNLEELPPRAERTVGNPRRILSQRDGKQSYAPVFAGDIVVTVYESGPAKLQIENSLYDEFVHVLEGGLILTDAAGVTQKIDAGGFMIMPKGFSGTFEMVGDTFREMVVIERDSFEEDLLAS